MSNLNTTPDYSNLSALNAFAAMLAQAQREHPKGDSLDAFFFSLPQTTQRELLYVLDNICRVVFTHRPDLVMLGASLLPELED